MEGLEEPFVDLDRSEAAVPALLTVEEAARALRIGRSLAYQLARDYESSGGVEGLPVIRLGACMRVPRWALIELMRTGRVVTLRPRPRTIHLVKR